jgi:hypothetical protein
MIYDKGNVIEKRDLIFKDNNTPDPKGKHPVMIAIAVTEDNQYMYFLTLTSQTDKYFENPKLQDQYFLLKKTEYNMLKKSSLVNLQSIYKEHVSNDYPVAFVQPDEYRKLVRKFKSWQETTITPDEFYKEIKDLI